MNWSLEPPGIKEGKSKEMGSLLVQKKGGIVGDPVPPESSPRGAQKRVFSAASFEAVFQKK